MLRCYIAFFVALKAGCTRTAFITPCETTRNGSLQEIGLVLPDFNDGLEEGSPWVFIQGSKAGYAGTCTMTIWGVTYPQCLYSVPRKQVTS